MKDILRSLFALLWLVSPASAQSARKPNFVFILVDDMGYGDLSSFGSKDIRTPNIDRLGKEGVKLMQAYSNGPVCTPTRAAFITGRYQQRVGLEWALNANEKDPGLPVEETSIARMLKNNGYTTALIGKWHLGSKTEFLPLQHGFDEYFGITGGNADMYSHQNILGENVLYEGDKPTQSAGYLTEQLGQRSVDFINKMGRQKDKPFFLYLAFNAVHWPFQPPKRPDSVRTRANWMEGVRPDYIEMMHSVDKAVGQVLNTLDQQGLAKDTLVVFTSDNGGEQLSDMGPYFNTKGTLWEGGIHVPGLARWPAAIPKGKVSNQVTVTMDWTATFLAAAGVQPDRKLDGINLLPVLQGKQPEQERMVCWRIDRPGLKQQAIRVGKWKLVTQPTSVNQLLFDLERDPTERRNAFYDNQAKAMELREKLTAWDKEMNQSKPRFTVK
ncbi:MAG TPA: sulfatase-like hydrolase/transferase [Blastocatellia bacterium]|nr:sulfatase-like hydrolase/transferase [Blastocatellia bacterium]HMX24307.1 sulfatase-like hydrolase/transferase [Blastocatellia bacterium]HMY74966.1 sulfatase-like hydrolase/transferase [Blastocatellia bacterium]HMZ20591.1 sulfatase-like hydrolase/transferase [Blastocatellia bacterium]HNG34575.1 sulfatase-like hydrolase/transferase [Blastocatellia bacterium]